MKTLIAALLFALAASDAQAEIYKWPEAKVLFVDCGLVSGSMDDSSVVTKFAVTRWTGGCAEGKRDGYGIISMRKETVDKDRRNPADSGETMTQVGTFVRGDQVGLWCTTENTTKAPWTGKGPLQGPLDCALVGQKTAYRKQADGRWLLVNYGPPTYVDAGALEAESSRLIADAQAGRISAPTEIPVSALALGDLVEGGRFTLVPGYTRVDLRSKRVAIILSSNSLKEMQRFKAMRQGLIDAMAKKATNFPQTRAAFIAGSDPAGLLTALAVGLQQVVGSVVAADDLSVLSEGKADFVLLIDWSFSGNINLTEAKYDSLPRCDVLEEYCAALFSHLVSGSLISPTMKMIKPFSFEKKSTKRSPRSLRKGFDGLIWDLPFGTMVDSDFSEKSILGLDLRAALN